MVKISIIFLFLVEIDHGQYNAEYSYMDTLRIRYEHDLSIAKSKYYNTKPEQTKDLLLDSLIGIKLLAAHILPTNETVSLVHLLNAEQMRNSLVGNEQLLIPALPPLTRKQKRQMKRAIRYAERKGKSTIE